MNIYLAEEEVKGKREVVGAQRFPFDAKSEEGVIYARVFLFCSFLPLIFIYRIQFFSFFFFFFRRKSRGSFST